MRYPSVLAALAAGSLLVSAIALVAGGRALASPELAMDPHTCCWSRYLGEDPHSIEARAIMTLRTLGAAQQAYYDPIKEQKYGGFVDLLARDYIPAGYTWSNMIQNYSLAQFYRVPPLVNSSGVPVGGAKFVIVAVPTVPQLRLRTFAITEDQVVRVADNPEIQVMPWSSPHEPYPKPTGVNDPHQWHPLPWF
ncbi:MAG TPA: hypothetical protein VEI97_20765 [bacterium]|nr:hypothetical protein [bacterium]